MKPKRTLLVVDDSAAIRQQIRNRFLSDGFAACAEAENGKEALKIPGECHPDIIILGLSMPVMNGIEAAPALRVVAPQAPIILFTLFPGQLKAAHLTEVSISAAFAKSDSLELLLQKAHELVGE